MGLTRHSERTYNVKGHKRLLVWSNLPFTTISSSSDFNPALFRHRHGVQEGVWVPLQLLQQLCPHELYNRDNRHEMPPPCHVLILDASKRESDISSADFQRAAPLLSLNVRDTELGSQ